MKRIVIAIDGPAGAGKSTVAQLVARRLGYVYIDTGAMYRAVAWAADKRGVKATNQDEIAQLTRNLAIDLHYEGEVLKVTVDSSDVTEEIRTPRISQMVSQVAQIAVVRLAMLQLQREMASAGGVVMDGRDIGTHVLPLAEVKVFLTASIEERAKRRWLELKNKGFDTDYEQLKHEIAQRDKMDSERTIAPLRQAADAVLIDTSNMSINEAVDAIIKLYEEKNRP